MHMKSERNTLANRFLFAATLLAGLSFSNLIHAQEQPAAVLEHRAAIFKSVVGPRGTNTVRPGDLVTATISVQNFDDFLDTQTIMDLSDMVMHADGMESSGNLLAGTNRVMLVRAVVNPGAG